MTRSIAILATLHLGCFLGDCYEARSRTVTLAEDSINLEAPLQAGTNAIRLACSIHVEVPNRDRLRGSISWETPKFVNVQGLDVAGRLTIDGGAPLSISSQRDDDGTGPIRLVVGAAVTEPPCGATCDLDVEFIVRTTPSGEIANSTISGTFVASFWAESDELVDAGASVIEIACDPVEHPTIP